MEKLFDIFPKPEKVYQEWVQNCSENNGFYCLKCPYGVNVQRDHTCFDICMKGDFDLWMHNYDMSKPLLRRYVGQYEFDKEPLYDRT